MSPDGDGDGQADAANVERTTTGLDAYRDAREIVRMLQCPVCSHPLKAPITMPCGNTVCRGCLPKKYQRQAISYPNLPGRQEGFMCVFTDCGKEHTTADCAVDVTLSKVNTAMEEQIKSGMRLGDRLLSRTPKKAGRLITLYAESKAGRLLYDQEADLPHISNDGSDRAILEAVKANACPEMECQVCYGLLFHPITTRCGHTYCWKCLQRVLDHSQSCPSCRQPLQLPAVLPAQSSNKRLTEILVGFCPDALAERAAAVAMEETAGADEGELETPIFVCAGSFPGMPTPLFIFEPRYRLMMRRAWEGTKRFGMVLPNKHRQPQGELGVTPFMQYGTMLEIEAMHVYPDGRSHIWTKGASKFKIKAWGMRDEYIVADVERSDDLPIAEEEALEALQTAHTAPQSSQSPAWCHLSTSALLQICHQFVQHTQRVSAPWMQENHLEAFGPPPTDPAMFPYWLASILPIADDEKYRLIVSSSVRDRLLITVGWIKSLETHRWYTHPLHRPLQQ